MARLLESSIRFFQNQNAKMEANKPSIENILCILCIKLLIESTGKSFVKTALVVNNTIQQPFVIIYLFGSVLLV